MSNYIEFLEKIDESSSSTLFFQRLFSLVAADKKRRLESDRDPLVRVAMEEYDNLSQRADRSQIQDSCSIRNILRTRDLAKIIIDEQGNISEEQLNRAIALFRKSLYHFGPNRQYDHERHEHILRVLTQLKERADLKRLIKSIQKPFSHPLADTIIRETLQLPHNTAITDSYARQATLAAWLSYLRQSVGSCFATAPAIIIHDEQPEQFLYDIRDLFTIGQIKRTYGGTEYSVPLSPSWGAGDLKKPILLQSVKEGELEIWLSPGILAAFQTLNLVASDKPLKEKIKEVKTLLEPFFKTQDLYTTAEEIIKSLIMSQLSITEEDLQDYSNRSRGIFSAGGLMQMTAATAGGKQAACKQFYALEEKAHNAFKAICDNALLKSWEFTLASFAETKPVFTRWNLYSSLGLQANQPGGIGEALLKQIKEKIEIQNRKVAELNTQYEQIYPHIRYLETRLRTASSEKETQFIRAEYQMRVIEFRNLEEMRNQEHRIAEWYANLFDVLIYYYDQLFPKYFQEIYDADMHDVGKNPYDDSPAGFRLIYKYGRANTAQWNRITSPGEFIDALANFFIATEREITSHPEFENKEKDISDLITAIVTHVRSQQFLETAFDRMAIAHGTRPIKNPLENLDKIEKKPWVYTSGGSLENLVNGYYGREQQITDVGRWVENETELFVFLLDTLKQVTQKIQNEYIEQPKKSMLTHSPTHAFLLKPGCQPFRQGWTSKEFTYTWVRDQIILPKEIFIDRIKLDPPKMQFLIEELAKKIPSTQRHYFRRTFSNMWGSVTPPFFRKEIIKGLDQDRAFLQKGIPVLSEEELDRTLYELLPLFTMSELENKLKEILQEIPPLKNKQQEIQAAIDIIIKKNIGNNIISSKQLINMCLAITLATLGETSYEVNYQSLIIDAARKHGAAMPKPTLFADTNWVQDKFAFVVSPSTSKLELWRVDPLGITGYPMHAWQQWLNGTRHDRKWGVYTQPFEYMTAIKKPFQA